MAFTLFALLAFSYAVATGHTVAAFIMFLVLGGSAMFGVRGYRIVGSGLLIDRPGWATTLDLGALTRVEAEPHAMDGSLRLFGTVLFGYVGRYRNERLGWYRAYATAPKKAVVLRFADRTIVVTPDDPEGFVRRVRAVADGAAP